MSNLTYMSNSTQVSNVTQMSNLTHSDGHGGGYGNATLLMHPSLCTLETCDLSLSAFEYRPTVVGNTIYAALFAVFCIGQLVLGIKFKTWGYMGAIILGLVCSTLVNVHPRSGYEYKRSLRLQD